MRIRHDALVAGAIGAFAIYTFTCYLTSERERNSRHAAWQVFHAVKLHGISEDNRFQVPDGTVTMDGIELPCKGTDSVFVWAPPLDGKPVDWWNDSEAECIFVAHSKAQSDGHRWFVFTKPTGTQWLRDDQVDWKTHKRVLP